MWFVFAALTPIPAKIVIGELNSNLATTLRTVVMTWGMVFLTNAQGRLS